VKTQDRHLQAHRDTGGQRRPVAQQPLDRYPPPHPGAMRLPSGVDETQHADHALEVHQALAPQTPACSSPAHRRRGRDSEVQIAHALPVGLEELVATLVWLFEAQAVQPGRFLRVSSRASSGSVLTLLTGIELLPVALLDRDEQQQVRDSTKALPP
jgi:hypothetical protein